MLDLIETGQVVVDQFIDVVGRAAIEAVLLMSVEKVAVAAREGEGRGGDVLGWRAGGADCPEGAVVAGLQAAAAEEGARRGERAEVAIPAYEAMRKDSRLADCMLSIVLNGVSTRRYQQVLPEMAEQVGISRSQVSRETIEAGERVLKALAERDFSHLDILILYLDGMQLGDFHVIAAVGVDVQGQKHLVGLREGASENAVVAKALLEDLVARGVTPTRRRLFVIDGSQALRKAIDRVYGRHNPVRRCRRHKELSKKRRTA